MLNKSLKRGFTLLELLVVIAIIGILAAILFSYLGQSKDKGADAGVKSNLLNARSQAEVFYTNNNKSYEGVCSSASTNGIFRHVQTAKRAYGGALKASYADGTASTWDTEECHDYSDHYAVWVPIRSSTSLTPAGWCIDSRNNSKLETGVGNILPASGVNQYKCP